MNAEALRLANEYGITSEHPDLPVIEWKFAVKNDDTREGYWNWVASELRGQTEDFMNGNAEHQLSFML